MEKRILTVSQTGAITARTLIEPGVTSIAGNILDRNVRLHIVGMDLQVSGAGTVKFLLGTVEVFSRALGAAGSIFEQEIDLFNNADGEAKKALKLTVVGSVNVTGNIYWSYEYAGGQVVRTAFDAF